MRLALLTPPSAAARLHPVLRTCIEPIRERLSQWVADERAAGRAAELIDLWAEGRTLGDLDWSRVELVVLDGPREDEAFGWVAMRLAERRGCRAHTARDLGWPVWSLRELAQRAEGAVVWTEVRPSRAATAWVRAFPEGRKADLAAWGSRARGLGMRPIPWFETGHRCRDHAFAGVYPAVEDRDLAAAARSFYRVHLPEAFARYVTWEPHARAGVDPWLDVFAGRRVERAARRAVEGRS